MSVYACKGREKGVGKAVCVCVGWGGGLGGGKGVGGERGEADRRIDKHSEIKDMRERERERERERGGTYTD